MGAVSTAIMVNSICGEIILNKLDKMIFQNYILHFFIFFNDY